MKFTLDHLKIGLIVTAILLYFFVPKGSNPIVDHSAEIKAKDQVIESIARERDTYRAWKDEKNAELLKKDSLLDLNFKLNQSTYTKIDATLKNIPIRIAHIANNDDSIRAAFSK